MNGRANIVDKSRKSQLSGTGTAADRGIRFQEHDVQLRLGETNRRGQTIRATANNYCIVFSLIQSSCRLSRTNSICQYRLDKFGRLLRRFL